MRLQSSQLLVEIERFCQIGPVHAPPWVRAAARRVKQLCKSLFDYFHHHGRIPHFRLGYQKVKMLGHHHVADHDEPILLPGALQHAQEEIATLVAVKLRYMCWKRIMGEGTALITTAGYEVQIVPAIPAFQTSRHASKLFGATSFRL